MGFTDQKLYDAEQLKSILGSEGYTAGIRYGGTYGINPLQCLQGFKDMLVDDGMQIFESTAMKRLEDHTVYTHGGSITADHIIIAVDKLEPHISPLSAEVFHAQTFLSVTEPLTDKERSILFPSGEQMQCWDSKLVYTYFRLTADNRLLLGGGSAITTFLKDAYNNPGDHQARHRGLLRTLPAAQEPGVHPVLAGPDRHHARPAADHRAAEGPAAPALHLRLRGNSLGDVHRQFRGAQCARRCGRRLRQVLQLLLERALFLAAEQPRQGDRQARAVLTLQQLGQVQAGRQAARERGGQKEF